jgi:hypothetical protein
VEVLGDAHRRRDYDAEISKPAPNADIVAAILPLQERQRFGADGASSKTMGEPFFSSTRA